MFWSGEWQWHRKVVKHCNSISAVAMLTYFCLFPLSLSHTLIRTSGVSHEIGCWNSQKKAGVNASPMHPVLKHLDQCWSIGDCWGQQLWGVDYLQQTDFMIYSCVQNQVEQGAVQDFGFCFGFQRQWSLIIVYTGSVRQPTIIIIMIIINDNL